MTSQQTRKLDATFTALSDETRRAILSRLLKGGARLSDLAEPFTMTQTAVSKHVRVLSEAGLVVVEKRGQSRHCKLNAAGMEHAAQWLSNYEIFWHQQFKQLGDVLAKKTK